MSDTNIKEVTVGDTQYQVADLPAPVQKLITFYEFASDRLALAEKEFVLAKSASATLSNEISAAIAQFAALSQASPDTEVVDAVEEVLAAE